MLVWDTLMKPDVWAVPNQQSETWVSTKIWSAMLKIDHVQGEIVTKPKRSLHYGTVTDYRTHTAVKTQISTTAIPQHLGEVNVLSWRPLHTNILTMVQWQTWLWWARQHLWLTYKRWAGISSDENSFYWDHPDSQKRTLCHFEECTVDLCTWSRLGL